MEAKEACEIANPPPPIVNYWCQKTYHSGGELRTTIINWREVQHLYSFQAHAKEKTDADLQCVLSLLRMADAHEQARRGGFRPNQVQWSFR